ncbi:MAG: SDR family oxidoreductase [Solirubrobacterales bacterium]|nr:SDR family oxidoreductase [Solirubrobacterales bacterium]
MEARHAPPPLPTARGGQRVALVTGANRGIGLEVALQLADQGLEVVLTARDVAKARQGAERAWEEGFDDVHPRALDVTDDASVARLAEGLEREFGGVDVLVNNAGIALDLGRPTLPVDMRTLRATMETNCFGAWRVASAFVPAMRRRGFGRVVNVSSRMGALPDMGSGSPAYRLSKTGLNVLTRVLSAEIGPDEDVLVNSASPGDVRTAMGGEDAPRDVQEGADTIVWLATLPADGPRGGFFADRTPIAF